MPDPTANQVHYDPILSNVAVLYRQNASNFVAGQVFPTVPVDQASGTYWRYPKEAFFRDDVAVRPMGGRAPLTGFGATRDTYSVEEEALGHAIDDREPANASGIDVERTTTIMLTQQMLIHRDRKFAAAWFKTGVWGTDVTGVTSSPSASQSIYWNLSTSLPVKEVAQRKRAVGIATGFEPNVLVIGSDVEIALHNHPDVLDRIKYTERGIVTNELLASLFGVDRLVVAVASRNSADEGQTASMATIFDAKGALLAFAPPAPSLEMPSAGYIMAWSGLLGAGAFPSIAPVSRYRDELAHSTVIEARSAYSMKTVASDLGVYFSGIVQ